MHETTLKPSHTRARLFVKMSGKEDSEKCRGSEGASTVNSGKEDKDGCVQCLVKAN